MITLIKRFLSHCSFLFRRKKNLYRARFCDDIPEVVPPHEVYILGTVSDASLAVLQCPCGCQSLLYLNLLAEESPYWKLSLNHDQVVSLHPSLWKKNGCKSHFFIKQGDVKWA